MQSIAKFLVFLLSLFLSTAIWSDSSESLLAQAREAESLGQYSTSLIHLRNAAMESPDNLEVRPELVKMFVFTGQGEQAKVELEKAEKLRAMPDQTALLIIKVQFYLGLYDEIIDQSSLINLPQQQIGQIRAMQGFAFLEQRKFNQARQMFERALSLSPKVMESQLGQVKLLNFQGKESEELKLVNQLLKQYPDHPEILMVAAESYRTQGQYDKALKLFEQVGRIQQANINVGFGTVRSYIGLNDLNNAKSEIQKILSSYPEHQVANYLLAVIDFQDNDYTLAKSAIDIVLKCKKRKFEALKLLCTIQFHQQDYTQAEKNLSKFLSLHSNDVQAIKTLASIYLKRQQSTLAIDLMKQLEELNDPYSYSMIAIAYEQLGNSEKSADYIEKSFQVAPDDQTIKRQFQVTQLETGKSLDITFEDSNYTDYYQGGHLPALNLFRQSIQLSETLLEPRINLARILVYEGGDVGTENIYRDVLKIKAHNDVALVALSGIFPRRGDDAEMSKRLNLSRKYNSASLVSRAVLEDYCSQQENNDKALEVPEEMISIQPENTAMLRKHADNLHAAGKIDLAVATYQKIVSFKPDFAASLYGLDRMQSLNGDLKAVQKSFQKVLELEPKSLVAWVVLIKLDLQFKQPNEALEKARKMAKLHPYEADSYDMLGDVYIALKQPKEAISYYQKLASIKFSSEVFLKLISTYNINNQTEKGYKQLQQWVKKYPDAMPLAEVLAYTYHQRNELDKARNLYEKIIKKTPSNDRILNRLVLVAIEQGSPMSLEYVDLSYNLNAKNPANMDTLGLEHLNNRNIPKALAILKEASQLAPADLDVRYHYAVALNGSDKKQVAIKQLYLALATEGKFRNRSNA